MDLRSASRRLNKRLGGGHEMACSRAWRSRRWWVILPLDALFLHVERGLYAALGPAARGGMTWRGYALAFLLANAVLFVTVWVLLMMQGVLPLNPYAAPNIPWSRS